MAQAALDLTHDVSSDVLYISLGTPQKCHTEEGPLGLLLRRSYADESPSGVTILDVSANWDAGRGEITQRVSEFLGISQPEVERGISDTLVHSRSVVRDLLAKPSPA